jgi:hypothetical protein
LSPYRRVKRSALVLRFQHQLRVLCSPQAWYSAWLRVHPVA